MDVAEDEYSFPHSFDGGGNADEEAGRPINNITKQYYGIIMLIKSMLKTNIT